MSKKLFLFGFGGTGARVIKALTMLLAAGVRPKTKDGYTIVPIILDPHKKNEDLKRTLNYLNLYQKVRGSISQDSIREGFFSLPIETLDQQIDFTANLQDISQKKFKDYINHDQMNKPNQHISSFLFSGKSTDKNGKDIDLLDIDMEIGFIGNPNIGSVVMIDLLSKLKEITSFANQFSENDRIFIIGSLFGGTGAAGLPSLIRLIRGAQEFELPNHNLLMKAQIGTLLVMPYFNVEYVKESPIKASDFYIKTRASLMYYDKHLIKEINRVYYLGEKKGFKGKNYKNDPGKDGQKNDAHLIEMIGALGVLDYCEASDNELSEKGHCREFGVLEDKILLDFKSLSPETRERIFVPLASFHLMHRYLKEKAPKSIEVQPWSTSRPQITKAWFKTDFYRNLEEFMKGFEEWLEEMARNERAFKPFSTYNTSDLDSFISRYYGEKKRFWGLGKRAVKYTDVDEMLNKISKHSGKRKDANSKAMQIFYEAGKKLVENHYH